MATINRTFNGKLNLDTQAFRIPEGDFIDGLNITRDIAGEGQDIVVNNVAGNERVFYSLPAASTNKVIGRFADKIRNRVYIFVWCSNNEDLILYYDRDNNTIVKVIQNMVDTDGDILDFNPSKRINHIDIIYDDQNGDLMFWTDGNSTPKKINVDRIVSGEYTTVKLPFIQAAKAPFLAPPTCAYGSDSTRDSNSLRRTLFQFCVRPQYDDFEKGVLFSFSKIPLPVGFYGSDNDIDNTKNNFITITIPTGDENVIALEIGMRYSIGSAWSDVVLVASLNKEQLSIPNNSSYQFLFYNDLLYPTITDGVQYFDNVQSIPLFFWVPQLAYCQVLANGNVPVYGAITEGYNNFPINELQVTLTAENVTNVPPDTDPPAITYTNFAGFDYLGYQFTVNGSVPDGTVYSVSFIVNTTPDPTTYTATYTASSGDTVDDVALGLYNSAISVYSTDYFVEFAPSSGFPPMTASQFGIGVLFSNPGDVSVSAPVISVSGGTPTPGEVATEKTWMQNCPYAFGLVYFDDQGRDMPGVITFSNPVDSTNDFLLTTPSFATDTGERKTPVISASINHLPPAGAVKYAWVRRRLQYSNWLEYETCDFQDPGDGFYYFCLNNIELYKEDNSQFIYGEPPITESGEQRIKVLDGITTDQYDGNTWGQDFQILGTVTRKLTGGTSPADDRIFIKVKEPASAPSPSYQANMLVMVYTPTANPTSDAQSVYYEWGETYDIYIGQTFNYFGASGPFTIGETITGGTSGATAIVVNELASQLGVSNVTGTFINGETLTGGTSGTTAILTLQSAPASYHTGKDQDQTGSQPATFTWVEGDVYYHVRTMYNDIKAASGPTYPDDTVSIMDENFSDFFLSGVNDNGRAQAIEVNAQQVYNPVLYRFGGAYQSSTTINNTPDFYFENFDEASRSWGDIRKLYIRNQYMYVIQKFKVGIVPILLQIIRDTVGNPLEANSDQLLNKINYPYNEDVGIGDIPESFASDKDAMYGVDNYKGVVWRLSQNGITKLSVDFECNSFFTTRLKYYRKSLNNGYPANGSTVYPGDPTVYGVFDASTNKYIIALQEINRYNSEGVLIFHQDPYTINFNEVRNQMEGFESFLSYYPDCMVCIDTQLIAFKDGETWTFSEDVTRCNFFGVQNDASITGVFNDNGLEKKTWQAITQLASDKWECPSIKSNVPSYGTVMQETNLVPAEIVMLEGNFHSGIKRDINSRGGKINGSAMKGNYIIVKLLKQNASELIYLNGVSIKTVDSPLTNK